MVGLCDRSGRGMDELNRVSDLKETNNSVV